MIGLLGIVTMLALAVLIAGLKSIVPERGSDVAKLGRKAVLAGTLANFLGASIVSLITTFQARIFGRIPLRARSRQATRR